MDVRTRRLFEKTYTGTRQPYSDWAPIPRTVFLTGHQRTESEGHPFSRIGKTGEDIGGNFQTERWYAPKPGGYPILHEGNGNNRYEGPIWPSLPPAMVRDANPTEAAWKSNSQLAHVDHLAQRGATAIANTTPTNPAFSAAAALGELREGIPSLPGKAVLKAKAHPKGFADDYLNFQFGIKPMLGDAAKLVDAHKKSEKILAQLYRDSGRLVRRRFSFPPEISVSEASTPGVYPWGPYVQATVWGTGTLTRKTQITRKYWFSGGYTYFFPKQEGWHRKIAELEKVYGVIPDANDLYQLTPWSWAVDWVSNTGDLIQNMTAFSQDSLVLRFGYVMCQTEMHVTETWRGSARVRGTWQPLELSTDWKYVAKQRQKATPYGFGLKTEAFSTRQKAIIAALGISKAAK